MAKVKDIRGFQAPSMQIGGRLRTLQFDLNAFAELEVKFGTIGQAMEQLQKGRMVDVRLILWTALIHDEAIIDEATGECSGYKITPYQVGGWIKTPSLLQEASEKLGLAMSDDMPAPENMSNVNLPEASVDEVSDGSPKMATVVMTADEREAEAKNG